MTQLYVMCCVSDTETMFSVWITAYEAHTLRRLGVSRCWTRAGVWHKHMLHIWLHWITSFFSNYYWCQHVSVRVVFVSVLIIERKKLQLQQNQTVMRLSLALLLQNQTLHQVHSPQETEGSCFLSNFFVFYIWKYQLYVFSQNYKWI